MSDIKDEQQGVIDRNTVEIEAINVRNENLSNEVVESLNESLISTDIKTADVESQVVSNDVPGPLLDIEKTDSNYTGTVISIGGMDRKDLESLVYHEAGAEGFIGACLVAQTIRDQMTSTNIYSARVIKKRFGYSAIINSESNSVARDAVNYVFDHGGIVVRHRLFYFYAPKLVSSGFHESQNFIVQYNGHRFFDRIN